jgi:hypothetical protein
MSKMAASPQIEMTIYLLRPDSDHFQWLTMANERDFAFEVEIKGELLGTKWKPVCVIPLVEEGMPTDDLGDYPTLGITPTFSCRATDALRPLLERAGELLPLISDAGEFYVYNVTKVVDALDETQSVFTRFQSTGRVMKIDRYVFKPDMLSGLTIFKVPQAPKGRPLVTQLFVDAVTRAGLSGFDFEHLWRPEQAGL